MGRQEVSNQRKEELLPSVCVWLLRCLMGGQQGDQGGESTGAAGDLEAGAVRVPEFRIPFACEEPRAGIESGTPDRIRTCDLRLRRPTLYPAELRAHTGSTQERPGPRGGTIEATSARGKRLGGGR